MKADKRQHIPIRTGLRALIFSATLLLAACGPESTPTTTTSISTKVPISGATSTALVGVTAEPTISSDSPQVDTPVASETNTPDAARATMTPVAIQTPGAVLEGDVITITMNAQNDSNQGGTATITDMKDGSVNVALDITGPGTSEPQPAHIHRGTCANLDPNPAFPLADAVDGKSTTEVTVNFRGFTSNQYALNVHKSAAEANVYVSCGDITIR